MDSTTAALEFIKIQKGTLRERLLLHWFFFPFSGNFSKIQQVLMCDFSTSAEGPAFWKGLSKLSDEELGKVVFPELEFNSRIECRWRPFLQVQNSDGYWCPINFNSNSFNNCQNFTIGGFDEVWGQFSSKTPNLVAWLARRVMKRLLIIDVNDSYVSEIKRLFPDIVSTQSYISTNGSSMTIMIIKVF